MAINKSHKKRSGFTLIEIIVATVIIGIIANLLSVYLLSGANIFKRYQSRKVMVGDASESLNIFSREASLTYTIITSSSKNYIFSTTQDTLSSIDYEINTDGTFTRRFSNGNKELLARNIDYTNSGISYSFINGYIRRIRIDLVLTQNGETVMFSANVSPETLRG